MPICGWLRCSEVIQDQEDVFSDRCFIFKILHATEFYTIILSKVQSKPNYKKIAIQWLLSQNSRFKIPVLEGLKLCSRGLHRRHVSSLERSA
jgi:hypothetical protein